MATAAHPASEAVIGERPRSRRLPDRLPPLEGKLRSWTTAGYVAVLTATLLMFAAGTWFRGVDMFVNAPASARYDFRTSSTVNGAQVAAVGEQASAAGLQVEDRLVAIDNVPLPPTASEFEIGERLSARASDAPLLLKVRRDGAGPLDVQLPLHEGSVWERDDPLSGLPLWAYAAAMLLIQPEIILFVASLVLFRARRSDPEAMMFAFAFLLLYWTTANLWWLSTFDLDYGWLSLVGVVGWTLSFVAVGAFPDGRFEPPWARWLIAGGAFVLAANLLRKSSWDSPPAWTNVFTSLAMLALILAAITAVALRYRRTAVGIQKQQIKWAAAGFAVTAAVWAIMVPMFLSGVVVYDGNPIVFVLVDLVGYSLGFGGLAVGLLISLLRFRLYDVEAVISRSAAYAFLTLLFATTLAICAKAIEVMAEEYFSRDAGAIPGVIAAGIAVLLVTPLHNRIQNWAERRFQKSLSHLRRDLPERVGDLRETCSLAALLDTIIDQVLAGVRASRAAVVIGNDVAATRGTAPQAVHHWLAAAEPEAPADKLDCDWKDPLFPMRIPLRVRHEAQSAFGWLLLGPRPDGSFYSQDEREALLEISDSIARGIRIVLVREARQAEIDRHILEQEERIFGLERQLKTVAEALERLVHRGSPGRA